MVHAPRSLDSFFLSVLFLVMIVVYTKSSPIYKEKGKSVTLKPTPETSGITMIEWKHGTNIAADWFQQTSILTCYNRFEGRCEVNTSTGALTITGLTSEDTGSFSVNINHKAASKFELKVISSVAKPSINKSCDAKLTDCFLTCEGETPDAQPITYGWPGVDGHSESVLSITKELKVETFSCVMKNPISDKSSESIPNPFMESQREANLTVVWVLLVVVVVVVVLLAIGVAAYKCIYKRRCRKDSGSYDMAPTEDSSNHVAGGTEFQELLTGNPPLSNGHVSGAGANHSSSPVGSQNGTKRAEIRVEVEKPDQGLPAPASQDTTEQGEIRVEVEKPDQGLPAPASQDTTEQGEIRVEVEKPDQGLPAPASQDTTEQGGAADVVVENSDQDLPASASQDTTKKSESLH